MLSWATLLVTLSTNLYRKLWCWHTRITSQLSKLLMSSGTYCAVNCYLVLWQVVSYCAGANATAQPFLHDIFSITTLLSKINKTIIKFSKQMLLKHQEQQLLAQDIHSLCSHTSCPLKHIYNPLLVCPAEVNLQYTFPSGNSPRSIVKDGVIEPLPKSVYYILLMVSRLQ